MPSRILTTYRMTGWGVGFDPAPGQRRHHVPAAALHHLDVRHLPVVRNSFARFKAAFKAALGFVPGWFIKLVALGMIWAYLHHCHAGLRHLWMDVEPRRISKEFGKSSAVAPWW
jgi:succinate dehydrogenase/fumarate reductase cytochrome b subunit